MVLIFLQLLMELVLVIESELLDDYETGEWTGAIGSGTANINNPWYVKVGKLVIGGASITAISDTSSR